MSKQQSATRLGSATIVLAISLAGAAMSAAPTVVTFEDLNNTTDYSAYQCGLGCGKLPSPITASTPKYSTAYTLENAFYAGITWDNTWYYYNQTYSGGVYVPHSGQERLFKYNNSTGPMANSYFWFGKAVKFDGAWFSGYSFETTTFKMYYKGSLVASSATLALDHVNYYYGPTWLASGYTGPVDEVDVYNYDDPATGANPQFTGWYVTMDDLTYEAYTGPLDGTTTTDPSTSSNATAGLGGVSAGGNPSGGFSVPEPADWALFLIGASVCGGALRRRRIAA